MLRLNVSNLIRVWARLIFHPPLRIRMSFVKGDLFFTDILLCGVLIFSTQNLIKSVYVVHAIKPCFELRAVKSKPTNNACNIEPRDC